MLISYGIKGLKSFKEYITIDMYSNNKLKEFEESLLELNERESSLPMMVLYGANGAGKTNFINVLTYIKEAISNFTEFKSCLIGVEDKIELQLELLIKEKKCIYNFEYSRLENKVINEEFGINSDKYHCIYRIEDGILRDTSMKYFNNDAAERIQIYVEDIEQKSLLLSKIASVEIFSITLMSDFVKYIKRNVINLSYNDHITARYNISLSNEDEKCNFLSQLVNFDSDIIDIEEEIVHTDDIKSEIPKALFTKIIDDLNNNHSNTHDKIKRIMLTSREVQFIFQKEKEKIKVYKYVYKLKGVNSAVDYSQLSDGTKAIIRILDTISTEKNSIFILDEIERSFHPLILELLLKYIRKNSIDNYNQFLITTHNVNLLDINYFRRDEIYFIDKQNAISSVYNLNRYIIRKDTNLSKAYKNGRFGAIPNLLNLEV